mgnify:CR=1 FL=1
MVVREDNMEPRKYDFVEVTLEPEDYDKVKASGCLFARKFHPELSNRLRERLKSEINE